MVTFNQMTSGVCMLNDSLQNWLATEKGRLDQSFNNNNAWYVVSLLYYNVSPSFFLHGIQRKFVEISEIISLEKNSRDLSFVFVTTRLQNTLILVF